MQWTATLTRFQSPKATQFTCRVIYRIMGMGLGEGMGLGHPRRGCPERPCEPDGMNAVLAVRWCLEIARIPLPLVSTSLLVAAPRLPLRCSRRLTSSSHCILLVPVGRGQAIGRNTIILGHLRHVVCAKEGANSPRKRQKSGWLGRILMLSPQHGGIAWHEESPAAPRGFALIEKRKPPKPGSEERPLMGSPCLDKVRPRGGEG